MKSNTSEQKKIPEIKQTACVHAHDAHTLIWIGPSTVMWLCPDCADGVSEELVARVYCAEGTETKGPAPAPFIPKFVPRTVERSLTSKGRALGNWPFRLFVAPPASRTVPKIVRTAQSRNK